MTLVAYAENTLYADRRALIDPDEGQAAEAFDYQKLHISKCQRFAYAAVGLLMNERDCTILEKAICKSIELHDHKLLGFEIDDIVLKYLFQLGGNRTIYLMTHDSVHLITRRGASTPSVNTHFADGSGGTMFKFGYKLIKGKKTLAKVAQLYQHISDINPLSGPLVDHVSMRDLKPITYKSEVYKP